MQPLGSSGLDINADARVAALESQSAEAAEKLASAAAKGTQLAFNAALALAQRYPHLAGLVEESVAAFGRRRATAEAAMVAGADSEPMRGFVPLVEAAAQLGAEQATLAAALEGVRRRDADMGLALQVGIQGERGEGRRR